MRQLALAVLVLAACERPVPMTTKFCQGSRDAITDPFMSAALPVRGVAYEHCGLAAHGPVCHRTIVDLRTATVRREPWGHPDDLAGALPAGTIQLAPEAAQELGTMIAEIRSGSAPTDRDVSDSRFQFGLTDGNTVCYVAQTFPPPPGHVIARFMARVASATAE